MQMYKDKVYPKKGQNRMRIQYVIEYKDGKLVDSTYEVVNYRESDDWGAKSIPVRELPSGRRTIRIEE
jgi:hypothetical protein